MSRFGKTEKYAEMFNKIGYTLRSNDDIAIVFDKEYGFVAIYKKTGYVTISRAKSDELAAVLDAVKEYQNLIKNN